MVLELVDESSIKGEGEVVSDIRRSLREVLVAKIYVPALWEYEICLREVARLWPAFPRVLYVGWRDGLRLRCLDRCFCSSRERHSGAAAGMFRAGMAFRVRIPRQEDSREGGESTRNKESQSSHNCSLLRTQPTIERRQRRSRCLGR